VRVSGYRSSSQVPGEGPNLSCENVVSSKVTGTPPERRYLPFSLGVSFSDNIQAKVELFEQIRREYEFGVGTVLGVARRLGVHRRMVRQALANAQPPERREAERERPVMAPLIPFIDAILEADRNAPRKQRHTARRIWRRILAEMPERKAAEATIREYVRERKRELGWSTRATCVPQSYEPGQEGQVDWYESWAELSGEPTLLQVFSMRSMASGAAFHRAYHRATQQAFLEAHEHAFKYFGGVFRLLRYDNLASAVKKILRGHQREEATRFIAFRSHWRFQSDFCSPAEPHEKGQASYCTSLRTWVASLG